jgi:hypothetical protein
MIAYNVLAVVLYLVPIAVVLTLRSLRDEPRAAWEIALDIPFTVAIDFLCILLLTRVMPLERGILAARALWVVGGTGYFIAKRREGATPKAPNGIDAAALTAVAGAAALSVLASMSMSRIYRVWDRYWHIPLSASLGGQKVPFQNVYEPGPTLHYHWMGDVFAQTFKTLSFHHLSSDVGLVLVHDVSFGLIGVTVALLMISFGQRRWWPAVLGGVATVLQGPVSLRGGLGLHLDGYAYHNFITNSLRPHLGLAGLLMTGFVGAVAVRIRFDKVPALRTYTVLAACTGLLAVTDEPSTMMLLGSLGVGWLLFSDLVAQTRLRGVLAFVGLAAAFALPNLVFGGSLAPGSPVQSIEWVAARVPGAHTEIPVYPMWSKEANTVIFCDFLPFTACALGLTFFLRTEGTRKLLAGVAFAWTVIALAFVGLTRVRINHLDAVEVQRYFVAPFFATYVLGLPMLHRMRRGSAAALLVVGGVAIAAASTIFWLREQLPKELAYAENDKKWMGMMENTMTSDCVAATGAGFGEKPRVMYVESSVWYLWVGCHPVFAPGYHEIQWTTKTRPTGEGRALDQLRAIHAELAQPGETIPAACLSDATRSDPVCARARAHSTCTKMGSLFELCSLPANDRVALLGGR